MAARSARRHPPAEFKDDQALSGADTRPPLTIRRACADDALSIIKADKAASELFRPTGLLSEEALADHVSEKEILASAAARQLDVAELSGSGVVGFVQFAPIFGDLYLKQVSVDPAFGKRGIGRALLRHLETRAEALGFDVITLSTFRDLAWNAPFYASMGYEIVRRAEFRAYMSEIEAAQAPVMDISTRVFMRKRIRKSRIRG